MCPPYISTIQNDHQVDDANIRCKKMVVNLMMYTQKRDFLERKRFWRQRLQASRRRLKFFERRYRVQKQRLVWRLTAEGGIGFIEEFNGEQKTCKFLTQDLVMCHLDEQTSGQDYLRLKQALPSFGMIYYKRSEKYEVLALCTEWITTYCLDGNA